MNVYEVNFDGLVGPTHHYGGLSRGNLASTRNKNQVSNPRQAALQGLEKMKLLHSLGIKQAILPPHFRPSISFLRECGFIGSSESILRNAAKDAPALLAASYSSAAMWTANAATVSPGVDCGDGKMHLTPANLNSGIHRFMEASVTAQIFKTIFNGIECVIHDPLPSALAFADEGAANHMRLSTGHVHRGLELFVFGRDPLAPEVQITGRFPARQSLVASQTIARTHLLAADSTMCIRQNPEAIEAGAFHNDVVAVANENVLFCHQRAFSDQQRTISAIKQQFSQLYDEPLFVIEIPQKELSLSEAVDCYLFNSQIVTLSDGQMALIAPADCLESAAAKRLIDRTIDGDNPIVKAFYPDVRQSMMNGGGPACLRLRVILSEIQYQSICQSFCFTNELCQKLESWIETHYRTELSVSDLGSMDLYFELTAAFEDLARILSVPADLFLTVN